MRLEKAAGKRTDRAVAPAFELRNFRHEIVGDIELTGNVDVSAEQKFARLQPHVCRDRARAARAQGEPHILDGNSILGRFNARRLCDRVLDIQLSHRDDDVPISCFLDDQERVAVFVLSLVKNDVAHFHPQTNGRALHGDVARAQGHDGSFASVFRFARDR